LEAHDSELLQAAGSTKTHAVDMSKGITGDVDLHGSMVINEGQIESVSGSLVGQDHLAQIFQRLLQSGCGEEVLTTGERFKTVTIAFPQHYYTISRRGPKIYVSRLAHNADSAELFVNSQANTVKENVHEAQKGVGRSVAQSERIGLVDERLDGPSDVMAGRADSDNESTTTSSSIATVKSEQAKADSDDEARNEEDPSTLHPPAAQEPHSIESSIQQSKN
jgi:hypothetical protein